MNKNFIIRVEITADNVNLFKNHIISSLILIKNSRLPVLQIYHKKIISKLTLSYHIHRDLSARYQRNLINYI